LPSHHEAPSSSRAQQAVREPTSESEVAHLLHARIARLPARMQAFWQLRYEAGLTQEEVAARLSLSRTSIRWLDSQFRKSLAAKGSEVSGRPLTDSP
jgi:RNA polymerase sigma factor (sigma-70 family)